VSACGPRAAVPEYLFSRQCCSLSQQALQDRAECTVGGAAIVLAFSVLQGLIFVFPALAVLTWLPLLALGIVIARLFTPLSWIAGRTQWFLKEGKEHALKAIGYVAAVVVFLGTIAGRAVFRSTHRRIALGEDSVIERPQTPKLDTNVRASRRGFRRSRSRTDQPDR
jgi:hypothetical protein